MSMNVTTELFSVLVKGEDLHNISSGYSQKKSLFLWGHNWIIEWVTGNSKLLSTQNIEYYSKTASAWEQEIACKSLCLCT